MIRAAHAGDLRAIAELADVSQVGVYMGGRGLDEDLAAPHALAWIAEDRHEGVERALGFVVLWLVADEATIMAIAVHPEAQRRGLGRALLRHAEEQARARGALHFYLEVRPSNDAARSFYSMEGYREVGRRTAYYDDGEDAVLMNKDLP